MLLVVPLWYRLLRPMCPDRPQAGTMGTLGTLTDASTPIAVRLGAERSRVQISPPRLGGSPLRKRALGISRASARPAWCLVVPLVVPDGSPYLGRGASFPCPHGFAEERPLFWSACPGTRLGASDAGPRATEEGASSRQGRDPRRPASYGPDSAFAAGIEAGHRAPGVPPSAGRGPAPRRRDPRMRRDDGSAGRPRRRGDGHDGH